MMTSTDSRAGVGASARPDGPRSTFLDPGSSGSAHHAPRERVDCMRHHDSPRPGRGFTLVELLVVMVVIGILIALILTAAMGGVRTAELRATQALIAKLEAAMTDRLDALTMQRAVPTAVHMALATVYNAGAGIPPTITTPNANLQRAQVLAQYDYLRAELPDVFYFPLSSDPDLNSYYPINFGMHYFPPTNPTGSTDSRFNFVLPLGTGGSSPTSPFYPPIGTVTNVPPYSTYGPYGTG